MLVLHFFLGFVAGPILQDPSREQLQLNCIMKLVTALEGMKVNTCDMLLLLLR